MRGGGRNLIAKMAIKGGKPITYGLTPRSRKGRRFSDRSLSPHPVRVLTKKKGKNRVTNQKAFSGTAPSAARLFYNEWSNTISCFPRLTRHKDDGHPCG